MENALGEIHARWNVVWFVSRSECVLNANDAVRAAAHAKRDANVARKQLVNSILALIHSVSSSALIVSNYKNIVKAAQSGPAGIVQGRLPTHMIELTTGYFIHDAIDMNSYGKLTADMVLHHVSSIAGGLVALLTDTCSGFWLLGASAELNSISLHIRSLLLSFKARRTRIFKANAAFFVLSFLVARVGIQGYGLFHLTVSSLHAMHMYSTAPSAHLERYLASVFAP